MSAEARGPEPLAVRPGGSKTGLVLAWAAGALICGLYAYATVAAVGNFIGMSAFLGSELGPLPWALLGLGVVLPAVVLVIVLIAGRRRSAGVRVLLLATGLTAVAAIHLEIMHLIS